MQPFFQLANNHTASHHSCKKIALLVRLSETKNKDADFEGNLC